MPEVAGDVDTTDELLVNLARNGDRAAREELCRRHVGVSYRVAYRLLGHEEDAHDAVQDGLIKAMLHLDDFDGRSGFRTWLIRIMTNAALDAGRKRKRRPSVAMSSVDLSGREPSIEEDPALRLRQADLRQAIDAGLATLKPAIRATFVMFAEAGLSYGEIASAQGVPIGTVMSRIHYARQKLQAHLQDLGGL